MGHFGFGAVSESLYRHVQFEPSSKERTEMDDNQLYATLAKWVCLTFITLILSVAAYYTATDIRWEPKMQQQYVHAH